jgi:hypothetical protein
MYVRTQSNGYRVALPSGEGCGRKFFIVIALSRLQESVAASEDGGHTSFQVNGEHCEDIVRVRAISVGGETAAAEKAALYAAL